jgi:hypothetical protein
MPYKPIDRPPKTCPHCGGLYVHSSSPMCRGCRKDWLGMLRIAHRAVSKAVATGQLKPIEDCRCVDCGLPAWDYEHRDYNQPTAVVPTCRQCNLRRGPGKPTQAFIDGVQARIRGHGYKKMRAPKWGREPTG